MTLAWIILTGFNAHVLVELELKNEGNKVANVGSVVRDMEPETVASSFVAKIDTYFPQASKWPSASLRSLGGITP